MDGRTDGRTEGQTEDGGREVGREGGSEEEREGRRDGRTDGVRERGRDGGRCFQTVARCGISAGPDISGRVSTHMSQSAVSGASIRAHCAALQQQVIAATEKLRTSGHCKQT